MSFYLILSPVLLLSIFMIIKLRALKKHDDVLFRFCQLRRDMMKYLRSKTTKIPREDYVEIRKLLDLLNSTIHNYEDHKQGLFRIEKFFAETKTVYKSVKKAKSKEIKNNAKVKGFYHEYGKIMLIAFLTYSPFLKSKIIIFLLIKLSSLLAFASGRYFNKYFERSISFLEWLRGESNRLDLDFNNKRF